MATGTVSIQVSLTHNNAPGSSDCPPALKVLDENPPNCSPLHSYRSKSKSICSCKRPTLKRKAGSPDLITEQFRRSPPLFLQDSNPGYSCNLSQTRAQQEDQSGVESAVNQPLNNLANDGTFEESAKTCPTHRRTTHTSQYNLSSEPHSMELDGFGPSAREHEPHASLRVPFRSVALSIASSDASSPSISQFPLPPYVSQPTPANSSVGRDEPRTPTIYHFRGASFELLNPSHSLRIQDNEPPAELDTDKSKYFGIHPANQSVHRVDLRAPMSSSLNKHGQAKTDRATPPRALFEDLPSAYQSITSRNIHSIEKTSSSHLPVLDSSASHISHQHVKKETELVSPGKPAYRHGEHTPKTASLISSFKDRVSRASETDNVQVQPFSSPYRKIAENHKSSNHKSSLKCSEGGKESRATSPQRAIYHKPQVQYSGGQLDETSVKSSNQSWMSSPNSRYIEREDESTGDLIAYYGDNYGAAICYGARMYPTRHQSLPLLDSRLSTRTTNMQTDTTIGEILDQYHWRDSPVTVAPELSTPNRDPMMSTPPKTPNRNYSAEHIGSGVNHDSNNLVTELKKPDSVRLATQRALAVPINKVPDMPLPADPPRQDLNTLSTMQRNEISGCSSLPSALSYGETCQVLLLSQSSFKACRGEGTNDRKNERGGSSGSGADAMDNPDFAIEKEISGEVSSSKGERQSEKSLEHVIKRDIKYLRRVSGLSGLHGSVYVVGGNSSSVPASVGDLIVRGTQRSTLNRNKGVPSGTSTNLPAEAVCVPVAAFQQSSVVPGIYRLTSVERKAIGNEHVMPRSPFDNKNNINESTQDDNHDDDDNDSDDDDGGDGLEWETLPDTRRTVQSLVIDNHGSHEWSSFESQVSSANTGEHSIVHQPHYNADGQSPRFDSQTMPKPSFQFGTPLKHPNRTVLAPLNQSLHNTYTHPIPLSQAIENPFTSSPPQIAGSSPPPSTLEKSSRKGYHAPTEEDENLPVERLRYNNGLVEHDQKPALSSIGRFNDPAQLAASDDVNFEAVAPSQHSSAWVSTESGQELSLEAEHGSPLEAGKPKAPFRWIKLSSGVNPSLVHVLRQGDPRMASSPLSRSNSFAKLSQLGPKSNVTGTPNGTGMREVGSSLIGSSPMANQASSPPEAMYTTSLDSDWNTHVTSQIRAAGGNREISFGRIRANFEFAETIAAAARKGGSSFRDAMMAESRAETLLSPDLAFQNSPQMEMGLLFPTRSVRPPKAKEEGRIAKRSDKPMELYNPSHSLPAANSSFPKLRRRYRSPSSNLSNTCKRKQKLSWILFGLCSTMPYMLILYGHGMFDVAVAYWTNGDIAHCGRLQKSLAKIIGWGLAAATIFVVVILFIVIRTVPNNFSR